MSLKGLRRDIYFHWKAFCFNLNWNKLVKLQQIISTGFTCVETGNKQTN